MKKGFTLIELLAVIVILAIIALIAVPTVSGIVEKVKKGGAESSALGWIDAVEKQAMLNELTEANKIDLNSRYNVSELISKGVKVKGQTPSSGYVVLSNDKVSLSTLCIGNYKVVVEDNKIKSSTKENNCVVDNSYPRYVYSRAYGATHVGYPIDAGKDMGSKYVWTDSGVSVPFNSLEECNASGGSNEQCVVQNFTTPNLDYKTSPDASWKFYLKHTLNSNGIIEEIDVCGKYNGQEFCLERSADGSKYEQNKTLLLSTFGNGSCDVYSSSVQCFGGSIGTYAFDDGLVRTDDDVAGCAVSGSGTAGCYVMVAPEPSDDL